MLEINRDRITISLMIKKLLACGVIGAFAFILVTTAWDYCRPDPDRLLFKGTPTDQSHQIKKPHHPCASLKDVYDTLLSFRVSQPSNSYTGVSQISIPAYFVVSKDSFNRSGLSPPLETSPPYNVPIFLLHSVLLI